jgi:hypothetical protein
LSYDDNLRCSKKSGSLSTRFSTRLSGRFTEFLSIDLLERSAHVPNNQSSHAWISRFCARLIRLQPALSLGEAVRRAVTIYPHSGDLEPEHAARLAAAARASSGTVHVGPVSTMRYRPVPLVKRPAATASTR